jgi:hypothetical protein
MVILKTAVIFSDFATGKIYKVDTIEYEGKMWLVPEWLDSPKSGWQMPARIICLDGLHYQKADGKEVDFVLNAGIPKSVFDGTQIPLGDRYVVLERPGIQFPTTDG